MQTFSKDSLYVIAEIGVNHEGDLEKAKRLMESAKRAGAHAVKFQTYKAEKIASPIAKSYWDLREEGAKNQFDLFRRFDSFGESEYIALWSYANELRIDFASTPFDLDAVDFLNPLVKYFKIASADITNLPLLRKVAEKGKPVILSTGASNKDEIEAAVNSIRKLSSAPIALLHCILNYPTDDSNANLRMISDLQKDYPEHVIGYSDHTKPDQHLDALMLAYSLGARIIEKHFTLNKNLKGNDHYHSMDEQDLLNLFKRVDRAEKLLGKSHKAALEEEEIARINARRSLFYASDFKFGQVLYPESYIALRPGTGLSPMEIDSLQGKVLIRDVSQGELVQIDDFL